jgi:hypothetical protein
MIVRGGAERKLHVERVKGQVVIVELRFACPIRDLQIRKPPFAWTAKTEPPAFQARHPFYRAFQNNTWKHVNCYTTE